MGSGDQCCPEGKHTVLCSHDIAISSPTLLGHGHHIESGCTHFSGFGYNQLRECLVADFFDGSSWKLLIFIKMK